MASRAQAFNHIFHLQKVDDKLINGVASEEIVVWYAQAYQGKSPGESIV